MIERYSRPEMAAIFSRESMFSRWLEVEIAVCEARARRGEIPPEAMSRIRAKARFDGARIAEIEAEVRHDVIAFLTSVGENVGPEARFIHYGLTSSDVVDTALSLALLRATDLVLEGLGQLARTTRKQALAHRHTVMVGRTHGVHAEPTVLGMKFLLWHADTRRAMERLAAARERLRVGKLSGAVGTFAHLDPDLEEEVCRLLGLRPAPISTQVLQRDRHAEYLALLGIVAANLEKIATEIRDLQRTDIREVEEPFSGGQKGSSAMPHKRNPVACENICGVARVVRSNVQAGLENIALWHERDISHSSVERIILPDSSILVDYMIHRLDGILDGLLVYPQRMRENLERTHGLTFSGGILLALVQAGISREEAYELVQRGAMKVWEGQGTLKELLKQDARVSELLSGEQLDRLFDLDRQLRNVGRIYQRVLGQEAGG
ncbi:MAG: adenylosuccinate lyase [Acidobacteriota bacterium]